MNDLAEKAKLVRKLSLISTTAAGSGHPTSCLSAADLTTVLFDKYYTFDLKNPENPNNDRFVLSKGHAAPLLYSLYAVAGAVPIKELSELRKVNSRLEGHPTPEFKYTEAATGSLGQGLSVGCGMALVAKKDKLNYKTYVLLGDGEMAEGSVWEAANFASIYNLDNLIAIVDVNRFGQSQETMFGHDVDEYVKRLEAFGWEVISIDGHNLEEIEKAFSTRTAASGQASFGGKPFAIVAKTKKGKGVSFLEDKDGWHGKPVKKEDLEKAIEELGEVDESLRFELRTPKNVILSETKDLSRMGARMNREILRSAQNDNRYKVGDEVATREVYGQALTELGNSNPFIYSLDAEVKNSTYAMDFLAAHPDRFVECFIAEQNMVGVALGLSRRGKIPFVSTFAAFLTRAFDQIRMARVTAANIKFVGSHAGISIGEDGASQMGLEDIAMFGAIPDSVILHPADGVSTAKLLPALLAHSGISYLRTLRPKTKVLYKTSEKFSIGGSKVLRKNSKDIVTVVAAGITVYEALKAAEELEEKGIYIRIIDAYSIKPLDVKTILASVKETKYPIIITVEDHFEHGGLGDMVLSEVGSKGVRVEKMAVSAISHSGSKDELLDRAGISAFHIVKKVKSIDKKK